MILKNTVVEYDCLSFDDKREFLNHHFYYEVHMLIYAYEFVVESFKNNIQDLKNISLENFALHARNVNDFFRTKSRNNKNKDDALSVDFLEDDKNIESYVDKYNDIIEYIRSKSNKQVSHLTYTRIAFEKENKNWEIKKVITSLLEMAFVFINNLDKAYLCENIIILKNEIENVNNKYKLNIKT